MINLTLDDLESWLQSRIKDESAAMELLSNHLNARAITFGARDAYLNVLKFITEDEND